MHIQQKKNELIIKLAGNYSVDELQDLADLFQFKELAKNSKASQKDVNQLVKKVKKARWLKTKEKVGT